MISNIVFHEKFTYQKAENMNHRWVPVEGYPDPSFRPKVKLSFVIRIPFQTNDNLETALDFAKSLFKQCVRQLNTIWRSTMPKTTLQYWWNHYTYDSDSKTWNPQGWRRLDYTGLYFLEFVDYFDWIEMKRKDPVGLFFRNRCETQISYF